MKAQGHTKNFGLIKIHSGQTVTETAILIMVITIAFVAMQTYLKRGVQGRIKSNIDQLGLQYDFNASTSDFTVAHASNTTTVLLAVVQPVEVPENPGATIDRTVTTSLSTTHYDNTTRFGSETVANP